MATLTVTATVSCTLDLDERDYGGASARDVRDLYRAELHKFDPVSIGRLVAENGGCVASLDVALDDETPYVGREH